MLQHCQGFPEPCAVLSQPGSQALSRDALALLLRSRRRHAEGHSPSRNVPRAGRGTKTLPWHCRQPAAYCDGQMRSIRLVSFLSSVLFKPVRAPLLPSHQAQEDYPEMGRAVITEESEFTCCFLGTYHRACQSQAEGGLTTVALNLRALNSTGCSLAT